MFPYLRKLIPCDHSAQTAPPNKAHGRGEGEGMDMQADKREFLALGLGLAGAVMASPALAQGAPTGRKAIPHRKATTTVLFQAPKGKFINGVSSSPEGIWICEQKESGGPNSQYKYKDGKPLEPATDLHEMAWLMDEKG